MTMNRLLVGLAGVGAAALLGGCGIGVTAGASPSPAAPSAAPTGTGASAEPSPSTVTPSVTVPTVTVPTAAGASSAGPAPTSAGSLAPLPAKFPLPDGAAVSSSVQDQDELAAQITIRDAAEAYDFWRSALPRAGYTVTKAESIGGLGEIRFRGHGCVGNSQLAVTGGTAQLECDQA